MLMQTLRLTRLDFRPSDRYWGEYVGKHQLSDHDGNLEIDANLGMVRFPQLQVRRSIIALAGTGIMVERSIQAGGEIKADLDITAGGAIAAVKGIYAGGNIKSGADIVAGWALQANGAIEAAENIKAATSIKAGTGIRAGGSIEASAGIAAGWGIKAGTDIRAGEGICSGLAVECSGILVVKSRVFAGLCLWRRSSEEEQRIICSKFEGGTVSHGILLERG
jgi:hypothetical protein